jgi:outer membrane protein OmpA-like peptidoglycan-associated protein
MRDWVRLALMVGVAALVASCGPKNMVVLIPDPDGSVGQITVSNAAGSVDIDQAHQATVIKDAQTAPAQPEQLDADEVHKRFGAVLAAVPPPPVHFMLYFQSDSVQLLPQSRRQLTEIKDEYQRRRPTRVSVVGHTDTLGDKAYNVKLSMRRAMAVKTLLMDAGIDESAIDISSHGEENPLVKTADNVANAKNRRVEVVIR